MQVKSIAESSKRPLKKDPQIGFQGLLSINAGQKFAECSLGAFCNTLTFIKLPGVVNTSDLSVFKLPF